MHEFNKCRFCTSYDDCTHVCRDVYCEQLTRSDYILDVNAIFAKADERGISVTDVLNLIRECEYDDDERPGTSCYW